MHIYRVCVRSSIQALSRRFLQSGIPLDIVQKSGPIANSHKPNGFGERSTLSLERSSEVNLGKRLEIQS